MSVIRELPDNLVNQIAAGEVIENPAAAVKELVENAIDAGADKISITLRQAGKSTIIVEDNGIGMDQDDLSLCLSRHATSKLQDEDLLAIHSLGFRGEALPSIGSVSRLSIQSRYRDSDQGWGIQCHGGQVDAIKPSSIRQGTRIEVADLFYSTPARLKFLKSDQAEMMAVKDILNRLAMAYPDIEFLCMHDDKRVFHYQKSDQLSRIAAIMGKEFKTSSMVIEARNEDVSVHGFASLPTLNKGNSKAQYMFVNGRPVRDKLLLGVLKGSYADVLAGNRYPMVALFIDVPQDSVDVNVHPAKAEVRFRNPVHIRNTLFHAIQGAIRDQAHVSAELLPQQIQRFAPGGQQARRVAASLPTVNYALPQAEFAPQSRVAESDNDFVSKEAAESVVVQDEQHDAAYPLGSALAQFHDNYIGG